MSTVSEFIPYEDFVEDGEELNAGEQIHINHDDCTAGADTKRRLYIKRTEDGTNLLAYCHNCSLRGYYAEDFSRTKHAKTSTGLSITKGLHGQTGKGRDNEASIPNDGRGEIKEWLSKHRTWVTRYGITSEEVKTYRIMASNTHNTVILPVYRDSKLLGYQERTFATDVKTPKYLTTTNVKPIWWFSGDYFTTITKQNTIVIVEDVLSGIKCARYLPTIALLGADMGDKLVAFAIKQLKSSGNGGNFIIFLDDDNRQVRLNQLKIKVKLEQCGYPVKLIIGVGKDPKCCSNNELEELLL